MLRWMLCIAVALVAAIMPPWTQAQQRTVALDQAGGKVAAEPPKESTPAKPKTRARELHKFLSKPTEKLRGGIDPGTPLKDALDTIARLASDPDFRIDFRIDYRHFKEFLNEDQDQVDQKKVGLPASPKGQLQSLEKLLHVVLGQVGATYLVQGDDILVLYDRFELDSERGVRPLTVNTSFDRRPLTEALEELSDLTGISVVIDAAVGENAKLPVSAALRKVPLPAAVRVLTNMAGLKPVVIDNVIYVTSKEKAQELIDDDAAQPLPLLSKSDAAGA